MRRCYIVSGMLLVLPIIDFAIAAPVLVQERRQAGVDVVHTPEDPTTTLGKRGNELDQAWLEFLNHFENHFAIPEESSAAHVSSSSAPSESGHVEMSAVNVPAPNPGPPTEHAHLLTGMHAPLSSPVQPPSFRLENGLLKADWSQPNTGPSNPSAEFGSDSRLVAEQAPSLTKGSSTESSFVMVDKPPLSPVPSTEPGFEMVDKPPSSSVQSTEPGFEMVDMPPSSPVSSTDPSRQAKKSRRNSGTARDDGNAAQSELQHGWSELLDPGI